MDGKLLGFYNQAAILAPGTAFLFGLSFLSPELKTFFAGGGLSVGNLGLFVLVSYVAGQLVAAGGNLVEWAWWGLQGGMPTQWPATRHLLPHSEATILEQRVRSLPGHEDVTVRGASALEWRHVVRVIAAHLRTTGKSARLDLMNAQYGMHRNLAAALLVLALVSLLSSPHSFDAALWSLLLASAALSRMHRFGVHYARELFIIFCRIPAFPDRLPEGRAHHG